CYRDWSSDVCSSDLQDFITASYLLSSKDRFYDRRMFTSICMNMMDANTHLDLPPPSILKPCQLWTGKQIFNILMRPNRKSRVMRSEERRVGKEWRSR